MEMARSIFRVERPIGFAEEGTPYDPGPPSHEHLHREWGRLRQELDRFVVDLLQFSRSI